MKYVDKTYIRLVGSQLEQFKETGRENYKFRCPYCGDSDKRKNLTRGYLFEKDGSYIFKCFNCPTVRSLRNFLKDQSFSLYKDYQKAKILSSGKSEPRTVIETIKDDDIKTDTSTHFKKQAHIGNKILRTLTVSTENDKARNYLLGRGIPSQKLSTLYYVEDINTITTRIPRYQDTVFNKQDAIVIPFIQDGIVTHLQLRMFDGDMRYMTLECESCDNKIYGLDLIDSNDIVYVFEGAFDAMFCNGIALANGALHTFIPVLDNMFDEYVFVYDMDVVSNKDILASANKSIANGAKLLLYDNMALSNSNNNKDLNDLINSKIVVDVKKYLKRNTYTGFGARMYLDKIKKIDKHSSPFSLM